MLRVVIIMSVIMILNRATIAELISDSGLHGIDTTEVRENMISLKKLSNNRFKIVEDMYLYIKLIKLTIGIIKEIWKSNTDLIFDIPACMEEKYYYSCIYSRRPGKWKRGGIILYRDCIIIDVDKKTFKVIDICWRNCKE